MRRVWARTSLTLTHNNKDDDDATMSTMTVMITLDLFYCYLFSQVGPQYLYSLFRSLVSMTTVGTGKQNPPQTTMSLMFCIFTYLCGVLIFATIVGNAADMIVDLRRHREKYHRKVRCMKFTCLSVCLSVCCLVFMYLTVFNRAYILN